jgi:hypothetical protein
MKSIIFLISTLSLLSVAFAQPANDNCINAEALTDLEGFCSTGAPYTTSAATTEGLTPGCWTGSSNNNVWFKFTAINVGLNIEINGVSLSDPQVALISTACGAVPVTVDVCNEAGAGLSSVSIYKGNLTIGQEYFIVVDGLNNNVGTFDLCINNFNPPATAGVDCPDAAHLCNTDAITTPSLSGFGLTEALATCMSLAPFGLPGSSSETNSVWYTFTAANNGSLEFTLDPLVNGDDLDWALFELTTGTDCNSKAVISCNTRSCIVNGGQTGLSTSGTGTDQTFGCPNGATVAEAFNAPVTLVAGRTYALLVENATNGTPSVNNGFTMSFGGTAEFVGPAAAITMPTGPFCTDTAYTFADNSTGAPTNWVWDFGSGATPATFTGQNPPAVSYSTAGTKTIVLTVDNGICANVFVQTIELAVCVNCQAGSGTFSN